MGFPPKYDKRRSSVLMTHQQHVGMWTTQIPFLSEQDSAILCWPLLCTTVVLKFRCWILWGQEGSWRSLLGKGLSVPLPHFVPNSPCGSTMNQGDLCTALRPVRGGIGFGSSLSWCPHAPLELNLVSLSFSPSLLSAIVEHLPTAQWDTHS